MTGKETAVNRVIAHAKEYAIHWRRARAAGDCEAQCQTDEGKRNWRERKQGEDTCAAIELEKIRDIVRGLAPLGGPSYLTIKGEYPLDRICVNAVSNEKTCRKCFEECDLAGRGRERGEPEERRASES